MKRPQPGALAVAASAALVAFVGLLVVQLLRHGWPFSLLPGIGVAAPTPHGEGHAATDVVPAHPEPEHGAAAHPRVEVQLDAAQVQAIGVRLEQVRKETLSQPLRAVATVVPDESRLSSLHTRVPGWIERLDVHTTGVYVHAGQPLAGLFSQELLSSQTEYLAARRAAARGPLSAALRGARTRLQVLGMTDAEIRTIELSGKPLRLVTVTAPRSGVVLYRGVAVGTSVEPSTEIFTVADLSRVWVLAEVPEASIPGVQVGTRAELAFPATGRVNFEAPVEFIYPTLSVRTRTLRVRFAVDNPDGALRPGTYGSATLRIFPRQTLTVSRDAVVDTGTTQHVFVVTGDHRFVPRTVTTGTRVADRIELREGVAAGELIVASGVFLLDSESRLRASGGGTGHTHGTPDSPSDDHPTTGQGEHDAHDGHDRH